MHGPRLVHFLDYAGLARVWVRSAAIRSVQKAEIDACCILLVAETRFVDQLPFDLQRFIPIVADSEAQRTIKSKIIDTGSRIVRAKVRALGEHPRRQGYTRRLSNPKSIFFQEADRQQLALYTSLAEY